MPTIKTKSTDILVTGPKDTDEFIKGLWAQNPVFVQVLGMCPTLAVTNSGLLMSNLLVSSLRRVIPKPVRIASYIAIIATFVTAVDYIIQAVSLELHKSLGAYVSLIVVNCIILGRAEAFASKNTVKRSLYDALGMGLGFTFALLCLGVVREILGSGTLFNLPVAPANFENWVIMLLPGGGFFVLGLWMLLVNHLKKPSARRRESQYE